MALETLAKMEYWANLFTKANWMLSSFAGCLYLLYPSFIGSTELPYGVYLQGVDLTKKPAYHIAYACEILLTPFAMINYVAFVNMFVAFIFFVTGFIRILTHKLRTIAESAKTKGQGNQGDIPNIDNALVAKRLRLYIENHKRIIRFFDEFNDITSTCILVETLLFGVLFLVLLFTVIVSKQTKVIVWSSIYIGMILIQMFVMYFLANEIIEESYRLAYSLYETPWFDLSIANQKTLLVMMVRAQNPMNIMIGSMAPMNLQTFQSILNVSYSYCNILRGGAIQE